MKGNIEILYEDNDIIAVNKLAGLVVHPDGRTKESTLCDWFLLHYPQSKDVGESLETTHGTIKRPGVVHRLDRETSGVLLLAKTKEGHAHLKKQFQEREMEKVYNVFVYGQVVEDQGVINRPIARSKKDFRLWSAQRGARGESREAVTHFRVIARKTCMSDDTVRRKNNSEGFSLVEASPKTGRTHQIRVHFKAINHPVVGDTLYAPSKSKELAKSLGFDRLALHARSLVFTDLTGKKVEVKAPYPEDFKHAIAIFKSAR